MATRRPTPPIPEDPNLGQSPWTLLGPGSLIQGDLLLTGNILIYGRVEGTIFTDGDVWIGPEATLEGGVHARAVVVEGRCRGRVEGLASVTIRRGAVVQGEVSCDTICVEDGARFSGDRLPGTAPPVEPFRPTQPGNA